MQFTPQPFGGASVEAYDHRHAYLKRQLIPAHWEKLIARPKGLSVAAVQQRVVAMYYYLALGWTVLPAHDPRYYQHPLYHVAGVLPDILGCSCPKHTDCPAIGKHPAVLWDETSIPEQPYLWETLCKVCAFSRNLSVPTGSRSGRLLVCDVDPRHGGSLETLWSLGWPENTVIEQTGGGGWHCFYQYPHPLKSAPTYGPGIEIKAEGSQIIVSPSLHQSGNRYA